MIKVTLDIYSGKPNPEYILSNQSGEETLKEIALNSGTVTKINTGNTKLGYRGINITFLYDYLSQHYNLPSSFTIANGTSLLESKGREIAENILHRITTKSESIHEESTINSPLNKWILTQLKSLPTISFPETNHNKEIEFENLILPCPYEKVAFEPDFWNQTEHVKKNNCYNFATNQRTDTFAQPGRGAGQIYNKISCENIIKAAIADGSQQSDSCFPENEKPRFLMALVVAPGPDFTDYHWYRQCSDGNWAHKPGQTPARNTDNSNRIITDPSIADRGPYTEFCSYMLAPRSINIK
ncbi:hypothetical protein ACTHPZ_02530 [Bacillus halotolerans]|uniref:hypothetical protein n=1 Tax=Bacillus halotolerans TaxID=260554 RepID=UPI003F7CA166